MGQPDKRRRKEKMDRIGLAKIEPVRVKPKNLAPVEQARVKARELTSIQKTVLARARSGTLLITDASPKNLQETVAQLLKSGYIESAPAQEGKGYRITAKGRSIL